jgi:hypothetical protein
MRKFLLAATMMVPFAAFAGSSDLSVVGNANLATTSAGSTAGVQSSQGTQAKANAAGNGGVIVGAVSGNYTSVETTALGKASPAGSYTDTTATQTNLGGTAAAEVAINKGRTSPIVLSNGSGQANGASGSASGGQNSQASGDSSAHAANTNVSGFLKIDAPKQNHQPSHR